MRDECFVDIHICRSCEHGTKGCVAVHPPDAIRPPVIIMPKVEYDALIAELTKLRAAAEE